MSPECPAGGLDMRHLTQLTHLHVINFGGTAIVYSTLRRLKHSGIPALPPSLRALHVQQEVEELDVGAAFRQPQVWGSSTALPAEIPLVAILAETAMLEMPDAPAEPSAHRGSWPLGGFATLRLRVRRLSIGGEGFFVDERRNASQVPHTCIPGAAYLFHRCRVPMQRSSSRS